MRGWSRGQRIVVGLLASVVIVLVTAAVVALTQPSPDGALPPAGPPAGTDPPASTTAPATTTTAAPGVFGFTELVLDADMAGDCKAVGDIDGDGRPEGVVGGASLVLYRFPAPAGAPTAAAPTATAGSADPAVTRVVLRERAEREFSTDCQFGDLDGDGDLDLVVPDERRLLWIVNPGPAADPFTTPWPDQLIGTTDTWTHDVVLADLDGDGTLDVVTRRQGATDIWLHRGDAWSRHRITDQGGEGTAVGDVDGDGDLDIVAGGTWYEHPDSDLATDPEWTDHQIEEIAEGAIPVPDLTWGSVAVADIDGDGRNDIVYGPMEDTGRKFAWYSPAEPDASSWTEHLITPDPIPAGIHSLQVADMDGDGRLDVVTARMHDHQPSTVSVWVNGGDGTWTERVLATTGLHNLRLADVDGDGDLDIFGANYVGTPPVRLYRNTLRHPG